MIKRLADFSRLFATDDPVVFILAPSRDRAVPAGDTRRGTAWIFTAEEGAHAFSRFLLQRNNIATVPVAVRLRELCRALEDKDLTYVLDPAPQPGYGEPQMWKAPLSH